MLIHQDDLKEKWKSAVRWLGDELERVNIVCLPMNVTLLLTILHFRVFIEQYVSMI